MEESSARSRPISAALSAAASWRIDAATGRQIWKTYTIPEAPAADQPQLARHAAPWTVRRRRVGRAGPRCGAQSRLHRHRRRYSQPAPRVERRHHGAGDGHRPDRLGAPDARGRRLDDGLLRSRHRPARRTVLKRPAPISTSAPRPRWSRSTTGAGWSWRAEVRHAARGERRERRHCLEHARRRGWRSRRHRVGLRHRRPSAFVSLSSAFEKKPGEAGGLVSVNLADGKPRWTAPPSADTCGTRVGCNTGQPAAVSAMPGVSSPARSTDTCAPTTRPTAR